MPSTTNDNRPYLTRQRSNSVPSLGLVNVSAEEESVMFSAAQRAMARRKRPLSVDSPGPVVNTSFNPETLPAPSFNFSTPSRLGFGTSPLKHVQRSASVNTLPSETTASPPVEEDPEDVEPTPLASTFPSSARLPTSTEVPTSPVSPRKVVHNPVLKAYADGIFSFTQTRLNSAAPETLRTLGLRRDPSVPPTPELDINELPSLKPPRPTFHSQFSDWSSTQASSVIEPSSPPSPMEPRTPDDQCSLMTPDSFFAEVTPRVAQTAQWAASLRASSNLGGDTFFLDSPTMGTSQRSRTDSVTSSEAFSYFAGFDGATEAVGTRLSNDLSPVARQFRLQQAGRMPRSQPASSASNHPPYTLSQQAHSPYAEMMILSRTPSWQVSAMG